MAIYVQIDGIKGTVTEEKHKEWIEVFSFAFGIGRHVGMRTGAAAGRETGIPSMTEITLSKYFDGSSLALYQQSLTDVKGKKVKIDFVRTGDSGGGETYAKYELEEALISNYSVSSGGDTPMESITLNFTKISFTYSGSDIKNATGTSATAIYDLATTKLS